MPNLTLTITDNIAQQLDTNAFALAAHQQIADTVPNAGIERCKTTINPVNNYLIADGTEQRAFAQLDLQLLSGRDIAVRQHIAEQLSQLLQTHLSDAKQQMSVQTSVTVTEYNRDATVLA